MNLGIQAADEEFKKNVSLAADGQFGKAGLEWRTRQDLIPWATLDAASRKKYQSTCVGDDCEIHPWLKNTESIIELFLPVQFDKMGEMSVDVVDLALTVAGGPVGKFIGKTIGKVGAKIIKSIKKGEKIVETGKDIEKGVNLLGKADDLVKKTKGIITKNGTIVDGFTKHAIDSAIGDTYKRLGVKPESILDTLKNPLKIKDIVIDSLGRPSQKFVGKNSQVAINPKTKKIVSVNPTSSKKAKKLKNKDG